MKSLLWLASYPKSGNTWLRLLFANYLAKRDTPLPINEIGRYAIGDAIRGLYEREGGPGFALMDEAAVLGLRPKVLERIARSGGKVHLVKTHNQNARLAGAELIPRALTLAAVYIVRDPLDMLVSYAAHYGMDPETAAIATAAQANRITADPTNVTQYLGSWSDHVRGWADARAFPVHCLRYEDLSADTEGCFRAILDFLGFDIDEARLARAVEFSRFDELRRQEDRTGFIERPKRAERFFRSGRVGEGRAALPREVVDRVVAQHRKTIKRFGYDT